MHRFSLLVTIFWVFDPCFVHIRSLFFTNDQTCPFISGLCHADAWPCHDKFSPCHGDLDILNVTSLCYVETQNHVERCYQFPCLTRSMTSECVFVICDMWVWCIGVDEWVKRSHNNTNCMILRIQTGLTPSTRHGIVFVVRYGWWLCLQTDMSVSSDNLVEFFQSSRVFFSTGSRVGLHNFFGYTFSLLRVNLA